MPGLFSRVLLVFGVLQAFLSGRATQRILPVVDVLGDSGELAVFSESEDDPLALAPHRKLATVASYFPTTTGTQLSAGNLVGMVTLPSAYTLSFDLMPTAAATDSIRSILFMGPDASSSTVCLPSIFFPANSLAIQAGYRGNPTQSTLPSLLSSDAMTPDTWMSVTIIMDTYIQLYMHMHMTAEVASSWSSTSTNNKVTLVKAMASSFTNVYIYASSPFSGETAATAKMRYLKITSPDSLPASFYPSSSYTNNNGGGIYKGNLVGMVVLPKAYTISFEFYPTASNANGEFLLSLTAKGWTTGLVAGQRLPAVQVCGSSGWGTCPAGNLYVVFNSWGSGNADYYYYSTESKVPPLST